MGKIVENINGENNGKINGEDNAEDKFQIEVERREHYHFYIIQVYSS